MNVRIFYKFKFFISSIIYHIVSYLLSIFYLSKYKLALNVDKNYSNIFNSAIYLYFLLSYHLFYVWILISIFNSLRSVKKVWIFIKEMLFLISKYSSIMYIIQDLHVTFCFYLIQMFQVIL